MDKIDKFKKQETFYKHPLEDCVLRTTPTGMGSWHTYIGFSGEDEYQPRRGSNIVIDSLFMNEPEWITKEEFYNF